jgi:tRNA threonylcarbamoyladenosine biosynthesis protein TsaE
MSEIFARYSRLEELPGLVEKIKSLIPSDAVIALKGELAAGKSTFVKCWAKSEGVEDTGSPTFSIQHIYGERLRHYDLYRKEFEELYETGLVEEFEKPGLHFVEWMDERLGNLLLAGGLELWEIEISPFEEGRIYRVKRMDE